MSTKRCCTSFLLVTGAVLALLLAQPARAQDDDATGVTKQLWDATATVRVAEGMATGEGSVTVVTGVAVAPGLLVTYSNAPASASYRVTLTDGGQADATLRVVDLYSGLSLLEIDSQVAEAKKLTPLEAGDETAPVGSTVLTAAAAGLEKPLVSRGILGGIDRTLGGSSLPPLLQCDVRTTSASVGAAIVDNQGKLLGIVAAPGHGDGWTYAVPVRHVQRLLRARADEDEKLVVLRRRRPTIGLTMVGGREKEQVLVERVEPQGPARRAGVQQGDQVLEVDGLKIRNVYQVVSLILKRQPGDRLEFLVQRDGEFKKLPVTLGGGAVVDPATLVRSGGGLRVRRDGQNRIVIEPGVNPLVDGDPNKTGPRVPRDELSLLQEQVKRFAAVIEKLQQDLRRRDGEQEATQQLIESLQKKIRELEQQLDEQK